MWNPEVIQGYVHMLSSSDQKDREDAAQHLDLTTATDPAEPPSAATVRMLEMLVEKKALAVLLRVMGSEVECKDASSAAKIVATMCRGPEELLSPSERAEAARALQRF